MQAFFLQCFAGAFVCVVGRSSLTMSNKGLLARSRGGKKAKKPRTLTSVKSGIGLSSLDKQVTTGIIQDVKPTEPESFITSRTARVLLAGAGFLADAYDLFVINLVLRLLREEYPDYSNSGMLHAYEGSVASAALFGSILGQIVAGSLADIIGRKKIFVATALLISIGSIGSSMAVNNSYFTGGMSIYGCISIWRFLLGVGVGGEYPLAATVTSESSSAGRRGSIMAAVFAMQGVGALISVLVVLLCLKFGFSSGFTWRFALAFGAVPAAIAFPYRLRMHETETFERVKQERRDAAATVTPSASYGSIASLAGSTTILNDRDKSNDSKVSQPLNNLALATSKSRYDEIKYAFLYYKWHMLGTALSWFLLDVDFYANGIFNHDVTALVLSHGKKTTAVDDAWNSALLCCIGVPGYWLSILYLEKFGRKNVQINGFIMMGILFFICGIGHDWFLSVEGIASGRQWIFLLIYSLTFLFSNFGPNTTTFVIPGEIYPAEVRATCHGLSAACGKLGAATGAYFFPMILGPGGASNPTPEGLRQCMFICSFIAALGSIVTYLFIPRYDGSDLEIEDNYLVLEHKYLIPSDDDLELLRLGREARAAPYTMLEIIDTSHNYSMDYLDTYNASDVLDENGALRSTKSSRKEFSTIDNLGLELVNQEV